jgi:uncharacterized peroxidase-related enzyme
MAKFPTLGDEATMPEILKMSPEAGAALLEMTEPIMRGPSSLTPGERELIAAYVSGLNECSYCHGVHSECAKAFGISGEAIDRMYDDLDGAGFEPKLVPLLKAAGKLTDKPSSITEADTQAVYDAGWDEKALHDAIMVAGAFNLMNRILEGHGVHGNDAMYKERGPMLKEHGYLPLVRLLRSATEKAAE